MFGAAPSRPRSARFVVACADIEIAEAIERAGGRAMMTDPSHPVGTDRIYEAVSKLDPERRHDVIVNVQGDLRRSSPPSCAPR